MINWLDAVLAVLVFYSAAAGWRRGLIRQLFDVAGVIAAYFIALSYSGSLLLWLERYLPLSRWLPSWFAAPLPGGLALGQVLASLVGFVLLFFAVRLLLSALAGILHGLFSLPLLGSFNGLGGLLLGGLKGLFLALVAVGILSLFATPFWRRTLEESAVATALLHWVPYVYEQLTEVLLKNIPAV
jgi:membrane protein required for colicin V production